MIEYNKEIKDENILPMLNAICGTLEALILEVDKLSERLTELEKRKEGLSEL